MFVLTLFTIHVLIFFLLILSKQKSIKIKKREKIVFFQVKVSFFSFFLSLTILIYFPSFFLSFFRVECIFAIEMNIMSEEGLECTLKYDNFFVLANTVDMTFGEQVIVVYYD